MAVRVVVDSASDMPRDIAGDLGITIVPASVIFGDQEFKDGVDLQTDEFFDRLLNGNVHPQTSQPSVGDFAGAYRDVASDADGIVSIHVSSKVSGTFNSAVQGAERAEVDCPIEVIDSLSASMGTGLVGLAAARAAQAGASLEEVADVARSAVTGAHCICLLDTLEYLEKGGRIGKARAMMGSLLRIKPMIAVVDGAVDSFARERTRRKGIERLRRAAADSAPVSAAAVMYSTERGEADRLADSIRSSMAEGAEPIVARFGPALGTYVGPDALGMCMMVP